MLSILTINIGSWAIVSHHIANNSRVCRKVRTNPPATWNTKAYLSYVIPNHCCEMPNHSTCSFPCCKIIVADLTVPLIWERCPTYGKSGNTHSLIEVLSIFSSFSNSWMLPGLVRMKIFSKGLSLTVKKWAQSQIVGVLMLGTICVMCIKTI